MVAFMLVSICPKVSRFLCWSPKFPHMVYTLYIIPFLMVQRVKNLPAMQETPVQSPGREDPLEKEMATRFSILAWRIPWTEEPGGLQSVGSQRVSPDWVTNTFTFTFEYLGVWIGWAIVFMIMLHDMEKGI